MKKTIFTLAIATALMTTIIACSKEETKTTETPTATPTLYERVGGATMVNDPNNTGMMIEQGRLTLRAVVDSSILVIAADTQMTKFFPVLFAELGANNTTGLMALSKNFTDFMCFATGCKNASYLYTGMNMKDAHNPAKNNRMGVKASKADFDKFVGDIGIGLAKNGVTAANNEKLVNDLVALLYTTEADIVQQ
ncbi:MAG: group 1 truncated hemoglobin [Bacteroidia bacterium]|nr:group 1 truncated hemoglobin [Bacteroidia bacterium]MCF8426680.1 group 1 truncated hemoglobin [Bacteroidia bacterium]MCF8447819.1 group 1 truncated hemoglobin [Bacteroidia bacterium]